MTTALDGVKVEVAFSADPNTTTPAFVDLTTRVSMVDGITINRGRSDEFDTVQAGHCRLAFDNSDGALTPGGPPRSVLRLNYATNPRLAFRGGVYVTEWTGTGVEWIEDQFDSVEGRALPADVGASLIDGGVPSSTYTITLDGGHA